MLQMIHDASWNLSTFRRQIVPADTRKFAVKFCISYLFKVTSEKQENTIIQKPVYKYCSKPLVRYTLGNLE